MDQGVLGHITVKPTTLGMNLSGLMDLQGLRVDPAQFKGSKDVPSPTLAQWAPQLKSRIAEAVVSVCKPPEIEALDAMIRNAKLSAVERASWQAHLQNDHVPYRADCSTCLLAAGTGKPHRRMMHPTPFSLALDIAGPFKTKGRDFDESKYKYLLVGAYRILAQLLKDPKVEEEVVPEDTPPGRDGRADPDPLELDEGVGVAPVEDLPDFAELFGEEGGEEPKEDPGKADEGPGDAKDNLEEKVKELKKPLELRTLYLAQPLLSRKGPEVLQAIQNFRIQLKRRKLPLDHIHSDQAREFQTQALRTCVAEHSIYHTRSSGSEPAGNSTAELGVCWVKARTRALLFNVPAKEWPMAAQHAVHRLGEERMPSTGRVEDKVKPAFGQVVWFKTKGYVGVKEKKADAAENPDLPPRWKKGFCRGRAPEVPGGHIICRSDGGLVIAKGIRDRMITPSPHVLPELEAHELARRITGKTTPPGRDGTPPGSDGTAAVAVLGAATRQTMVAEILGHPKVESLAKELREMPESKDQDGLLQRSLGAFQHGSVGGLSILSRSHPELVQTVCQLIRRDHPTPTFTSVTLSRNTHAPFPKDCPNDPNSVNLVSPLQVPSEGQGGMWVELEYGDSVVSGAFGHRRINDKDIPVNSMDLRSPVRLNPNRKYGLEEGDKGSKDRIIVVAHTMQG